MKTRLAQRMHRLQASPIRDVLASAALPGMISFAGGLPASESFPAIDLSSIETADLQYGSSEGEPALREHIALELQQQGFDVDADRVLILSGSQQGIDLVAKLMVQQGSTIAVESPTYLAALQVFTLFGAEYVPFSMSALENSRTMSVALSADLLYINPTFQNPSSQVYTASQRQRLAIACDKTGVLLFEDDPYRELYYEACHRQPVCSMLKNTDWIYQSSFSKTFAPGLRLGYLVCSENLYPHLLKLKQAADLHSNRVSQRLIYQWLSDDRADERLMCLRAAYRDRRDQFNDQLHQHFARLASWQIPAGGLFFWLTLNTPKPIDTRLLLQPAIDAGVTFMPGEPFFITPDISSSHIRLNFSQASPEDYGKGLATLSAIVASAANGSLKG